jgi:GNAT superfamily N-acetyltransferase
MAKLVNGLLGRGPAMTVNDCFGGLAVYDGADVAGCLLLEESSWATFAIYVHALVVEKTLQKHGIGRALLKSMIHDYGDRFDLYLYVDTGYSLRDVLLKLYTSVGMTVAPEKTKVGSFVLYRPRTSASYNLVALKPHSPSALVVLSKATLISGGLTLKKLKLTIRDFGDTVPVAIVDAFSGRLCGMVASNTLNQYQVQAYSYINRSKVFDIAKTDDKSTLLLPSERLVSPLSAHPDLDDDTLRDLIKDACSFYEAITWRIDPKDMIQA